MLSLVAFIGIAIVAVGLAWTRRSDRAQRGGGRHRSGRGAVPAGALGQRLRPIVLGVLLFLWGTGLSVIRTGVLPKWLGWVMIVLGVVGFTPIGFVSAIGAAILVLVLSVLLTLRARSPVADAPGT